MKLNRNFFARSAELVAPELLGCELCTWRDGIETAGIIVEAEAYGGSADTASHAFGGRTKRNAVMFGVGGFCYVYFIYGMHYCVNVVTGVEGEGSAVLIRALMPTKGEEAMRRRRGLEPADKAGFALTNGPGKLCQALAIDTGMLGEDLLSSRLIRLTAKARQSFSAIKAGKRIGISSAKSLPWRYYLAGSRWVSRP